jgi:CubicO group peptidase (beta-lactamase class C family)
MMILAVALSSCAQHRESVAAIVDGNDLAGAALAVAVGGEIVFADAAGCALFDENDGATCLRPLTSATKLRVASISKLAVALALHGMASDGVVDLDADVSHYVGFDLRHPGFPDQPITLRMLLSHTSGVRDPQAYWVAAPGRFQDLIAREDIFGAERPGYFAYANINYGIAAAAMEKASGKRFDLIMTERVLAPLGLDAGFNWSGVSAEARRNGAALYRRHDGVWAVQTDGAAVLNSAGPVFLSEDGLDTDAYLAGYQPGDNPTLFSPQGGLRASSEDLLVLVQRLREHEALAAPVWRYDPEARNGDAGGETGDDRMVAFGAGAQIVEDDPATGRGLTLVGHAGEAYGLYSGAWLVRAADNPGVALDIRIAFAVNGTPSLPQRVPRSSFYDFEAALIRIALDKAGVSLEE